jgi:hypothetical protein
MAVPNTFGVKETNGRISRGFTGSRRTPDLGSRILPIPLPTPSHDAPELLKAALKVFVAEGQTLDGPEDLTEETTAQTGF